MEINIILSSRNGSYAANAVYNDGNVIVKKGGRIDLSFADHIRGGKMSKKYRESSDYVDSEGNILRDCEFSSPSTAAQFVTGRSTNGYEAWKVEKKISLGKYLENHGLR